MAGLNGNPKRSTSAQQAGSRPQQLETCGTSDMQPHNSIVFKDGAEVGRLWARNQAWVERGRVVGSALNTHNAYLASPGPRLGRSLVPREAAGIVNKINETSKSKFECEQGRQVSLIGPNPSGSTGVTCSLDSSGEIQKWRRNGSRTSTQAHKPHPTQPYPSRHPSALPHKL